MYFYVKYIDLETFKKSKDSPLVSSKAKVTQDTIKKTALVKNKELVVNPDCFLAIIIDYIFEEVGIDERNKANFDIMTEKGKLLEVHCYDPDYSGLDLFEDQATYYIAQCNNLGQAKPLLNVKSKEYIELKEGTKRRSLTKSSRKSNQSKGALKLPNILKEKRRTMSIPSSERSRSRTPD